MRAMRKLIGDPLVHFLVIGAAIFVGLSWYGNDTDPQQIRLSAEQVRIALSNRLVPGQSIPGQAELETLIEPLIRDEVMYREALALGLDTDDDQVRTRLIEKMRYLSEDLADPEPADEAELRALFDAAPARFAVPEAVTFEQVYFSPSQRGAALEADAERALQARRNGEPDAAGDSTPLGEVFAEATRERLEILFGDAMTSALFELPLDQWSGPYESDFGLHIVRVDARRPARQPEFGEVIDEVRAAFAADRRTQRNANAWSEMRSRYDVTIDWPEEFGVSN
jgi:hypothetical protein